MKLKDWAEKQGISYLTAWRWFKAADPRLANAYQSDSGTIIVPDEFDATEQSMGTVQTNDVMSSILKKTVELSKNNGSVEDFAAWILSNFSLKSNSYSDSPKYTRNKPKSEEVQKHFQKFIKPKGEKPKPNMFVAESSVLNDLVSKSDDLTAQELVEEINKAGVACGVPLDPKDIPEVGALMKDLVFVLNGSAPVASSIVSYGDADGIITRSVDITPQSLNYTGSGERAISNNLLAVNTFDAEATESIIESANNIDIRLATFKPTQKELDSASKISALAEKPRRGRKSTKNLGNK